MRDPWRHRCQLEDLVGAYVAFNRDGIAGRVRYTTTDATIERRLLSPGAAWIVREILESNPRPGELDSFDRGTRPRVAWKTGTSYGFRDAWAIGGTRTYTVGVWVGRPDGTPLPGQYGAVTALPLLFEVVDSLPNASDALRSCLPQSPKPRSVAARHRRRCATGKPMPRKKAWTLDGAGRDLVRARCVLWNEVRRVIRWRHGQRV